MDVLGLWGGKLILLGELDVLEEGEAACVICQVLSCSALSPDHHQLSLGALLSPSDSSCSQICLTSECALQTAPDLRCCSPCSPSSPRTPGVVLSLERRQLTNRHLLQPTNTRSITKQSLKHNTPPHSQTLHPLRSP